MNIYVAAPFGSIGSEKRYIVEEVRKILQFEIFEEISKDIDVNGQDRDFYEIRFMKEEIKILLNCLKELKTE